MSSPTPNIFLYGGARSAKSVAFIYWMMANLMVMGDLRMLVARLHFSDAKTSLWHETVYDVWKVLDPRKSIFRENRTDWYLETKQGSELWLGGFDEKERIEKMLGHEYNAILFNEVSQITYDTIELGLTRLAKNTAGFENKAFYDCNPPSPLHWAHKLFIEKRNPKDGNALINPEDYWSMLINPIDNKENLPSTFFKRLDALSERAKRRMLYGEWVKPEGAVYEEFAERHIISKDEMPSIERYCVGIDFGLNCASVLVGWASDTAYIIDDYGAIGFTAQMLNNEITRKWGDKQWIAWCDPSGGERLFEIFNSSEANNAVEPGIDFIQTLIHNDQFFVVDTCRGVLSEIWDYRRDEKGKIVKENDHYLDCVRYAIFSERGTPVQIFIK